MTFAQAFDALPAAERAEVLRLLEEALMYRSGGQLRDLSRQSRLEAIAEVFRRNGSAIGEYT